MAGSSQIVVFLPNWVGDAVMATPTLRALRAHFAGGKVHFVGKPAVLEVLAGAGLADAEIIDRSTLRPRLWNAIRLGLALRSLHADAAVLLPNSFRSALIARLSGARRRVGYARDGRGWLLTDKLSPPRDADGRFTPVPTVEYYARLAEPLGAKVDDRRMSLAVVAEGERAAEELLAEAARDPARPLVMLNPGGAFGPSKMWDASGFAAVADAAVEKWAAQIIINCAPSEQAVGADIAERMKHPPLINFATRENSLSLLKSLLRRCRLLITNDTGARHVAAAMGTDVVTIFASTDPRWTVINYDRERIVCTTVRCAPCQQKVCPQPPGPLYQQCTRQITQAMVLSAAEELLTSPRQPVSSTPAAPAVAEAPR